jgi:glutathione S-transferase
MIKLLVDAQYASPYALSAYVALREKQVNFALETVDLGVGAQSTTGLRAQSPTWRVPTLLHGDFRLTESSAIAEYVDEMFLGPHLYPLDPRPRARCRQVQAWLRSDLAALREERTTEVVFYGAKAAPLSAAGAVAAEKLLQVAGALVGAGQPNIGAAWSVADVDLALMLNRLVLHGDAVPPALRDYAAAQWARPTVQEWVAKHRPPLRAT